MRPTPIPDHEIWEGATRKVILPPDGDMTNPDIAPVEALVDRSPSLGSVRLSVRCELEDDDLHQLQAGGTVWITFWGGMVPWSTSVLPPAPCPTCSGPVRETTGLVCQTCGTDYGKPADDGDRR
jgi:hypothetical protein